MNGRVDIGKCVSGCGNLIGNYKGQLYCQLRVNGQEECIFQDDLLIKVREIIGRKEIYVDHHRCKNTKYIK